jgi:aspartyl/asparaginyl beta-hydroxylase (cupin superfamily)
MTAAVEGALHIRRLLDAAAQAAAAGLAEQSERLWRQAATEAPRHPLVLAELARRLLNGGDAENGEAVARQALAGDSGNADAWLTLAASLRMLNRPDEELLAVKRVLAFDPRNLRALLQKASLYEMRGDARMAAATYRTALQFVPPGIVPPEPMRQTLEHARQAVAANARELEAVIETRLASLRERHDHEQVRRFDRCLEILLQKQSIQRQRPSLLYFPELAGIEFPDRGQFPWLDAIEAQSAEIRAELLGILADHPAELEPYVNIAGGGTSDKWRQLNQSRRWSVYYLWREGVAIADHLARCPRTVAALEAWPRCEIPGRGPSALFSILDAHTHIPAHSGVMNTRLLVHLPLVVPPGCRFRVGGVTREWRPGQAFVFDDSFEHEAWNDSDMPRAVLIFDIWNPAVSSIERDLVREMIAAVGEYYGDRGEFDG